MNLPEFDYEIPHECQYPVYLGNHETDCGEPAPYYVWWPYIDATGEEQDGYERGWWVCGKHFKEIKKAEEEDSDEPTRA